MKDEKYTGLTPAAVRAAVEGDMENFLAAITPGGIEAQEARGQRDLVASGNLPRRGTVEAYHRDENNRTAMERLGFVFGRMVDTLFVEATLPGGWSIRPTSHSMWSTVFDAQGRARMSIFYKAAFYDRNAFLTVTPRYVVQLHRAAHPDEPERETHSQEEWLQSLRCYYVADYDGTARFIGEAFRTGDFQADSARYQECEAWLEAHYPDYRNPFAYWNEEAEV